MKKIVFLVGIVSILFSKILVVDDDYSLWTAPCEHGSRNGWFGYYDYSKISDALSDADDYDTIKICPGVYKEQNLKIIQNNLTIVGIQGGREDINITNSSFSTKYNIFSIKDDITNLIMDNFTIIQTATNKSGIYSLNDISGGIFKNLLIKSQARGIFVEGRFSNPTIIDNIIKSKKEAIYLKAIKSDVNISENNLSLGSYGIRLLTLSKTANYHIIQNNIIRFFSTYGISLETEKKIGYEVTNNCLVNGEDKNIFSKDEDGYFNQNYYNDNNSSEIYTIPDIPKYDTNPKKCCSKYNGDVVPIEMEGGNVTLPNTYDDPNWKHIEFKTKFSSTPVVFMVINKVGGNPASVRIKNVSQSGFDALIVEPQGEDGPHIAQTLNYLAVNKGVHKLNDCYFEVGEIQTTKIQGRYASGNKGWQEIYPKVFFSDPVVIANIQTLNNEENPIPKKPSKPWMTAVIENNTSGIYLALDRSETDDGDVDKNETIGYMIGSSNLKGSFIDSNNKQIQYETIKTTPYFVGWDDSCKKVDFKNSYSKTPLIAGWKNTRRGGDGGWFRRCYLDKQKIGFVVDEDRANDSERHHIPEVGGIFVFSDNFSLDEIKSNLFKVKDNRDDNNITTKIVNKSFSLEIYTDAPFKGTLCSQVIDNNEQNLTSWNKNYFDDVTSTKDTNENNPIFKVSKATKEAYIKMVWKKNVDENCPLNGEVNSSISQDNFAVRPKEFNISDYPSKIYAGGEFGITFKAFDNDNNPSNGYNEENSFEINVSQKKGCIIKPLNIDVKFENGKNVTIASYDEVGELNITIQEKNTTPFAMVDLDDTNLSDLMIKPTTITITSYPYFMRTYTRFNDKKIIYDDKNLTNYFAEVNTTLIMFNKNEDTTKNFDKNCYSDDINLSYDVQNNIVDAFVGMYKVNSLDLNDTHFENWEKNWTISKEIFSNGEGNLSIDFNIYKNRRYPVSIVDLNFSKVEAYYNKVGLYSSEDLDNLFSFYYLKVFSTDIYTTNIDTNHKLYILVYDKNKNHYKQQKLLNWFIDEDYIQNDVKILGVTRFSKYDENLSNDFKVNLIKTGYDYNLSVSNPNKESFVIIHFDTPYYLWYSRFSDLNTSLNSYCSNHYCIEYHYKSPEVVVKHIGSGKFQGSEVNLTKKVKKRMGIKIYR